MDLLGSHGKMYCNNWGWRICNVWQRVMITACRALPLYHLCSKNQKIHGSEFNRALCPSFFSLWGITSRWKHFSLMWTKYSITRQLTNTTSPSSTEFTGWYILAKERLRNESSCLRPLVVVVKLCLVVAVALSVLTNVRTSVYRTLYFDQCHAICFAH